MMQTTLNTRNRPDVCRRCKVKLSEGNFELHCNPCPTKQQTWSAKSRRKWKTEEFENVSSDDREMGETPNITKVCKRPSTDDKMGYL